MYSTHTTRPSFLHSYPMHPNTLYIQHTTLILTLIPYIFNPLFSLCSAYPTSSTHYPPFYPHTLCIQRTILIICCILYIFKILPSFLPSNPIYSTHYLTSTPIPSVFNKLFSLYSAYTLCCFPAKPQKTENSNLKDLSYVDHQARVLNCCFSNKNND